MNPNEFWLECIANAAEECALAITKEQLAYVADAVQGSHENYGMAFHRPESPYPNEIRRLETELRKERDKIVCPECNGRGTYFHPGPYHSASGSCFKCRGEGKVSP